MKKISIEKRQLPTYHFFCEVYGKTGLSRTISVCDLKKYYKTLYMKDVSVLFKKEPNGEYLCISDIIKILSLCTAEGNSDEQVVEEIKKNILSKNFIGEVTYVNSSLRINSNTLGEYINA